MRIKQREEKSSEDYLHISSLIVQLHPDRLGDVYRNIEALADTTIYKGSRDDKLVVVLETATDARITQAIDHILSLDGVLTVNLVYQHSEAADALNEAI